MPTPALQSWLLRHTRGGRHGRGRGNRVEGSVSRTLPDIHGRDVRDVPARGDGVGAVPVAAGGDGSGADVGGKAAGARGQALDQLRAILPQGRLVAGGV